MAKKGRNVARKTKSGGAYTASRLPKEPEPMNINPLPETMRFQQGPTRVGALVSQREGDRIQRSEYKMPSEKKPIKPKPRPDVGAIERGNRAAKRTAQDLATQNFEGGGRIADVRDNPNRGKTY